MRYLLIDTANTFFRARHSAFRAADPWEKVGYALHIVMSSINKVHRKFEADHVVFALEGRSWRKDYYEPYKKNRAVARAALTETEREEDQLFWETFDSLTKYLSDNTNCSVIRHPEAEADDVIARWIALHPLDEHYIVSSDTDFIQLLAPNVSQYNGITDELHTLEGIFDAKGRQVIDKKTKQPKTVPDPAWLLFEKCMRGDSSDNVFSAYPGVREKGTKNKVGLREAYADRNDKGYIWNNLMLQRWTDHNGQEHRVKDDYERNCTLVDLTAQPDAIKAKIAETIAVGCVQRTRPMIGGQFLKFCGKYELTKLSDHAAQYSDFLSAEYPA